MTGHRLCESMAVVNHVSQPPPRGDINQEDAIPKHSRNHEEKINQAIYLSRHLEKMEKLKSVI
jgi:hypothetical protein